MLELQCCKKIKKQYTTIKRKLYKRVNGLTNKGEMSHGPLEQRQDSKGLQSGSDGRQGLLVLPGAVLDLEGAGVSCSLSAAVVVVVAMGVSLPAELCLVLPLPSVHHTGHVCGDWFCHFTASSYHPAGLLMS